MTVLPQF